MKSDDIRGSMVLLGAAATIVQALLLREGMTTLGGSELAWGFLLFLWLTGVALGARLPFRFPSRSEGKAVASLALCGVLGFVVMRTLPAMLRLTSSSAPLVFLFWLVAVLPPALACGAAFVSLARSLGAGDAYGMECSGAVVGGLCFTFLLAPLGGVGIVAALPALACWILLRPRGVKRALGTAVAVFVLGVAARPLVATATWDAQGHTLALQTSCESKFRRHEISSGPPHSVYSDGRLSGTFPADPYLERPAAEFLLLLHPRAERVAVIGGLGRGFIGPLLGPGVESLTIIEEDRTLVRTLSSTTFPTVARALADPRVDIVQAAPITALSHLSDIDILLLLDGPPTDLRANRTRTVEFFEEAVHRLSDDGVVVVSSGTGDTYLEGAAGRLLTIQANTLAAAFRNVFALAGENVLLLASNNQEDSFPIERELAERWLRRGPGEVANLDLYLPTLLNTSRSLELTSALDPFEGPVNSSLRPTAVLAAAAIAEGRHLHPLLLLYHRIEAIPPRAGALFFALVLALLAGSRFIPVQRNPAPAIVVGFIGMTWWFLLLAAWQATRGSVYAEIGLLSALFMAGLAAGSLLARRMSSRVGIRTILLCCALLSAVTATGLTGRFPLVAVPLCLMGGGLLVGAAFPRLAVLRGGGRNEERGISLAFAADEMGAAGAALVVGVVALPCLGSQIVAVGTALVCAAGLIAVRNPE